MTGAPQRPAAFLDRDGTLMIDSGFIGDPARIEVLPGVAEALRLLERAGYVRVVVTNQSGVARGYFGEPDVLAVHEELTALLAADGASVDAYYYCAHGPAAVARGVACDCRKPQTGMVERAVRDLGLTLEGSVVFGDRASDIALGANAGISSILVNAFGTYAGPPPLLAAPTLLDGVKAFLARDRAPVPG